MTPRQYPTDPPTMLDILSDLPAASQLQSMQRILLSHACNADIVLDLHCETDAALMVYALLQHWPQQPTGRPPGCVVGLLAEDLACSMKSVQALAAFGASLPMRRFLWPACRPRWWRGKAITGLQAEAYAEGILAFLAEQGRSC